MGFEDWNRRQAEKLQNAIGLNYDGTKISEVGKKKLGEEGVVRPSVPKRQEPAVEKQMHGDLSLEQIRRWNCAELDPESKTFHEDFKASVKTLYERHPKQFNQLLEHVFINSSWRLPKIPKPDVVKINIKRARFVLSKLADENKMHWIGNDLQSDGLAEKMREKVVRPVTVATLFHQHPQLVADHIENEMNLHRIPFSMTIKSSLLRPLD